ncbi:glycine cleavage system aminomethyltransferase GcvT [Halapricum hydrolyticum]|uniref:Probable aminomethyltransferase n=1 Tax=Halapricum hydrolyticum TaxID=2979991 RepID=A0AAE3IC57_9EURY|nr:glycine cleavage system aminomethyltransferase GcvT [Halapricum hydrolyticum]MCU4718251.1 glycine cleavage system aminomethyltransferase GcvT [Halapricum hydrolyticum]MCU4727301.1 glycine cleavage system aminomethyltransferase GcvT [Halapricum hydrolyticum]
MGRQTPLYQRHADRDASFTDFGGWEMPVEFDSIRSEHERVRESVGKFDVSHMGQIEVTGSDAERLLQRLTTSDVTALDPGEAQYAAITDEEGIMLEDTVVYRLPDGETYLFVPNAGNDEAMAERCRWIRSEFDLDAEITNATTDWAMIAAQGPDAPERFEEVTDARYTLDRFEIERADVAGADCLVAATGYTGEDGFEILVPEAAATTVWDAFDVQPCGLGARDTLRLEMGYLLSGQDFDPETEPRTPYEAGIGFAVKLDTEFVGRDALEGVAAEGPESKLRGVQLIDRGVPRHGQPVTTPGGKEIGHVTSGTMSPTLGEPIGLAYVDVAHADPDTVVRVVVRDEPKKARIRTTPFIDR